MRMLGGWEYGLMSKKPALWTQVFGFRFPLTIKKPGVVVCLCNSQCWVAELTGHQPQPNQWALG